MKANHLFVCFFAFVCANASAQQYGAFRIPNGQPSSITIAPDARSAAMGEAGVALSADANATYWNPAKLAVADQAAGMSASYSPWLRSLADDYWLGYASGYKKIGSRQALGASVRYFSYETAYASGNFFQSSDMVLSGMYSRALSPNFSMGLTLKYISSNVGSVIVNGQQLHRGTSVAADISAYYHKQIASDQTGEDLSWSVGAVLSNLGSKIDYGVGEPAFLPATIKIGGGVSYTASGRHRLNVVADLSKLMVPTPDNNQNPNTKPVVKGMVGSFSDAPDGFREELREIVIAMGAEYWYKNVVALRGGYYGENKWKGDRNFLTAGAGVRLLKNYTADLSYNFSLKEGNPLAKTLRVTVSAYFGGLNPKG